MALLISYLGVGVAFISDIQSGQPADAYKGSLLILCCAITYALYVLFSGKLLAQTGASFFTSVAMLAASAGVFIHFLLLKNSVATVMQLPQKVYWQIMAMAFFTTVLPSFLLSLGLKKIGASNAAIVASVGPISTIIQAYFLLGEPFGWLQAVGTVLVVFGVLIIGKKAE